MTKSKPISKTFNEKERRVLDLKRANAAAKHSHKPEMNWLQVEQPVRMQPTQSGLKRWKESEVTKILPNRSYEVKRSDGKVFRRIRQHFRPGVTSTRPAGHIWPAKVFRVARSTFRRNQEFRSFFWDSAVHSFLCGKAVFKKLSFVNATISSQFST